MNYLDTAQQILRAAGVHIDVSGGLALFVLALARMLSAFLLAPFIGGPSVPSQVKIGLALTITVLLMPQIAPAGTALPSNALVMFALLAKEVLVGSIIGFISQLVFYAVQMAGTVIDTQRGLNQISYVAPQLQGHTSAMGNLQFQAALVIFLSIDGHLMFIRTIAQTFRVLPILEFPAMQAGMLALMEQAARITAGVLVIGMQLAAPVVMALFLVDVAFASVGKVASQIRISNESNTAKALAGLAIMIPLTALLTAQLSRYFLEMLRNMGDFVLKML